MISKCVRQVRFSNSYLHFLGRPIDSLALNTLIEGTSEVIQYAHYSMAATPFVSVLVGSMALRGLIELTGALTKLLEYKSEGKRKLPSYINKLFMVDLQRDITFYNIDHVDAQFLRRYYTPSELFKYFLNGYLLLNISRGFNFVINHPYCSEFLSHSTLSLVSCDPTYTLPVAIMILNYGLLKYSQHPWLIHLRAKTEMYPLVIYSFMSGLPFVGLPLAYQLGWIGFMGSHILIRSMKGEWDSFLKNRIRRRFAFK